VLVFGTGAAGKSTFLRTLAYAACRDSSPEELHVYGLDFGSNDLSPLTALPHCGGVVRAEEAERVERLFSMLDRELVTRRSVAGDDRPRVQLLVLLDGYAGFAASFERVAAGALLDALGRLVADGRPLGIHFAISADRRGSVPAAIFGRIPQKLVLRMTDVDEFASLGVPAPAVRGAQLPPGRGFVDGNEAQIAMAGEAPGTAADAEAFSKLAERWRAATSATAPQVQLLPLVLDHQSLGRSEGPLRPLLGIGERDQTALAADLSDSHFLITAPRRGGRTTALSTLARSLAAVADPPDVHVLAPRRSALTDAPAGAVARGPDEVEQAVARLVAELDARAADSRPLVVLVDDADELAEGGAATGLAALVRRGRDRNLRVVAAAERNAAQRAFGNWIREIRNDENGLLLDPQVDVDGEMLGVRLPRNTHRTFPPGRGYLVSRGAVELVQVAR
jgi:S-DNA-T family DNA segregation ATPase FtsK/SpoIIIE